MSHDDSPTHTFSPVRSGEDRRSRKRHEDAFYVRVLPEDAEDGELCELLDISEGGMGVMTPKEFELAPRSTIRVEFPLGRSPSKILTRCHVRAVSGDGPEPRAHLEFLDTSPLFRATVASAIRSWDSRFTHDRRDPS